jgi:alkanesulfonate monooxygenase SsuD/methylene tetrahydromethanopterin reductase-like flavin-dependent oxidoreductase (luciferase family)
VDTSDSAARFKEAITIIQGLFNATELNPLTLEGRWFTLERAFLNVDVKDPPPVLVAAQAPRMLKITAEHADGWIPFALSPDLYQRVLADLAPRSPSFTPSLWVPTFVENPHEDRSAEAEATGRLYLSMAPTVLRAALGDAGITKAPTTWTAAEAASVAKTIPRELALSVTVHGPPSVCAEQLEAFGEAGCRAVVLRMTDPGRRRQDTETIARTVLPQLEGREVVRVR